MEAAIEDENGLHWSNGTGEPRPYEQGAGVQAVPPAVEPQPDVMPPMDIMPEPGHRGDRVRDAGAHRRAATGSNASRSAKWLVGQRNSQGGFGSTQDTVVALQALTEYATMSATDTDMTVTLKAGNMTKESRSRRTTSM